MFGATDKPSQMRNDQPDVRRNVVLRRFALPRAQPQQNVLYHCRYKRLYGDPFKLSLVEKVKFLRFAEAKGNFDKALQQLSAVKL
jgi:hypothetical protein